MVFSVDDRDLCLLNSVKYDSYLIFLEGLCVSNARKFEARTGHVAWKDGVMCVVMVIDYCNYQSPARNYSHARLINSCSLRPSLLHTPPVAPIDKATRQ